MESVKVFIKKFIALVLLVLLQFVFTPAPKAHAATSPTLGNADSFVILGGAELTDGDHVNTHITGDVGTKGGGSTNLLYCDSMVSGTMYTRDAAGPACRVENATLLDNANTDLVAAYNALSEGDNAPAGCTSIPDELGGFTYGPGVYCAVDSFTLNGTLTLSGTTGVWIFQSKSTLTTVGTDAKVVGGDPCNVWWQLPNATTGAFIGSGSTMVGNIVALGAITFEAGATLNGRALSRTKEITLIGNTITKAICSTAATSTPTPSTLTTGGSSSGYCEDVSEQTVAPTILDSRRVDTDSIFVSWGPYSGTNMFNVQYGTENGSWLYNTNVTGFSTTISNLPANLPIWVRVAARSYCTIGDYGPSKLVGSPGLPNTGFAPGKSIVFYFITVGALVTLSAFLLKRIHI